MKTYLRLPIFGKIFGFSITLLSLIGYIVLFSYLGTKAIEERENSRLIKIKMLNARKNEKDFFVTRNLEYSKNVNRLTSELLTLINSFDQDKTTKKLITEIGKYNRIFSKAANATVERGLDENQGAEGELRNSVHHIEDIIKKANQDKILIQMLSARRSKKDFLMRLKPKYIEKVKKAVAISPGKHKIYYCRKKQKTR